MIQKQPPKFGLRRGGPFYVLLIVGVCTTLGTGVLAARLIWEMTCLTWEYGPQMVGFSLAHTYGIVLFLFPLAHIIWLVIALVVLLVRKIRGRASEWPILALTAAGLLALAALFLPQGMLNRVFVARLAASSHAAEFLVYAGADGDLSQLRALLNRGVALEATNHDGATALLIAARCGKLEMVRFLIDKGANVNVIDLYGDSPLHAAREAHQGPVADLLTAKGAKDLAGDAAQRQRASQQIVERDIEQQNTHTR
jgi:hypothetical protein